MLGSGGEDGGEEGGGGLREEGSLQSRPDDTSLRESRWETRSVKSKRLRNLTLLPVFLAMTLKGPSKLGLSFYVLTSLTE